MFKLTCPECKRDFQHEKEIVVKRMLGHHRSVQHGFQTPHARANWMARHPGKTPPGATSGPQIIVDTTKAARTARWAGHVTPTLEEKRAKARQKYKERKIAERKAALKEAKAASLLHTPDRAVEIRQQLQEASWWQTQEQRLFCPHCGKQFSIGGSQ